MQAEQHGYEAVVINYRGLAGMELATPKLYNSMAVNDVSEPMDFIFEKYCRKQNRPTFATGVSMGANILANLIGF
jgi:predicted alpha/beta-fold hydrolase